MARLFIFFLLYGLLASTSVTIAQNLHPFTSASERKYVYDFVKAAGEYRIDSSKTPEGFVNWCYFIPILTKGEQKGGRMVGIYLLTLPIDPSTDYVCLLGDSLKLLRTNNLDRELCWILHFIDANDLSSDSGGWIKFLEKLESVYEYRNRLPYEPGRR